MPRVSIIIPTYNRATLIPEAVASVLAQSMADLDVIVVDDGSTDDTARALAGFESEPRFRYVRQENQGRSAARNHGASLARGDFLGFLDSDDRYLVPALAAHLECFARRADLGLTVAGFEYIDEAGRPQGERRPWSEGGGLDLPGWLFNCYGMPGSVLMRRAWFERTQGFSSACEIAEDWDLFLQLAVLGCPMDWVRVSVCQYRRHSGSSMLGLVKHRDGSLCALDRLFAKADLPPETAGLEPRARAWVFAMCARRAWAAAQPELARSSLEQALSLDPELGWSRKTELLELLVAPGADLPDPPQPFYNAVAENLPPVLKASPADFQRALARTEMAGFFRAVQRQADAEARQHLKHGLRRDPRWLANRGVLAFCLRQVLGGLIGRGG